MNTNTNNTRLVGFFGGGQWNKETKSFDIKKNISKSGNLSLGLQYKVSSKDMDGNKVYNGIKVKLMLSDKSEYDAVVKMMEDRCTLEGFFSAVQFEGSDGTVKYIEFVGKFQDFSVSTDSKPNAKPEAKKEEPEVEAW